MKCIDTSVLIDAERDEATRLKLFGEDFFIPALAAAEFLVGVRLIASEKKRQLAQEFYDEFSTAVLPLNEPQARILANLIADERRRGRTLKPYDAGIAAAALEQECTLLAKDGDFEGIEGLTVERL